MAVTPEWIAQQRADLQSQETNTVGVLNQIAGAKRLLDLLEEELKKPEPTSE